MSGQPRPIVGFISDLFGALVYPLTVVLAIVAVLFTVGDGPELDLGLWAALAGVFLVSTILLVVGLRNRWRGGSVFGQDRGKDATVFMLLGAGGMLLAAVSYFILR